MAPPENVENNSLSMTSLLKICSHCERLSKKVRKGHRGVHVAQLVVWKRLGLKLGSGKCRILGVETKLRCSLCVRLFAKTEQKNLGLAPHYPNNDASPSQKRMEGKTSPDTSRF